MLCVKSDEELLADTVEGASVVALVLTSTFKPVFGNVNT